VSSLRKLCVLLIDFICSRYLFLDEHGVEKCVAADETKLADDFHDLGSVLDGNRCVIIFRRTCSAFVTTNDCYVIIFQSLGI
jgi:hypothetical protein